MNVLSGIRAIKAHMGGAIVGAETLEGIVTSLVLQVGRKPFRFNKASREHARAPALHGPSENASIDADLAQAKGDRQSMRNDSDGDDVRDSR